MEAALLGCSARNDEYFSSHSGRFAFPLLKNLI